MTEFNCYNIPSSTETPILRPWPKCGLVDPPTTIIADVVISGDCDTRGGQATYNGAVFTKGSGDLADGYVYGADDRVPVIFWIGGLTGNKYDSSSGIFFPSFKCIPLTRDRFGGLCSYNYSTKSWNFSAFFQCYLPVFGTDKRCLISVSVIGIS
jgi:hypothetical protein